MTMVLYLYNAAFSQVNLGKAAAIGVILFIVIFTATLVQRRLFGQPQAY
jgi:ABC-type sugar transport system permease subunit